MFGRTARLPIDINTGIQDPDERVKEFEKKCDPDDEDVACERCGMESIIKTNILKAQTKQKKLYDAKHANGAATCFKVGSLVLKKDFLRKKRKGGKLDNRWVGPYTILASLGKGLFRLKENITGKVILALYYFYALLILVVSLQIVSRVNGFHLKKYIVPDSEDDKPLQRNRTLSPLVYFRL